MLEVLECGSAASIQDGGRFGYRRFGVSTAGAMDRRALALCNTLVGNKFDAAAIEIPLTKATFRVIGGPILIAACGPGTSFSVSGLSVDKNSSIIANSGDTIHVGAPKNGVYSYIAVAGGIQTNLSLDSRSTHRRSGIGCNVLSPGEKLPCKDYMSKDVFILEKKFENFFDQRLRVLPGPQEHFFDSEAWSNFLSSYYVVTAQSDRMGQKLAGEPIRSSKGYDILSEGVVPGSIQVSGDQKMVILGRDCQTTGGYPKIATVISADLDRLAQIPFGDKVGFRLVSIEDAVNAAFDFASWLNSLRSEIKKIIINTKNLLSINLIGGVTTGDEE